VVSASRASAESGRAIIKDQLAAGGRALHRGDSVLFAEIMLAYEMRSHREAAGLVFFDRGVPDVLGYYLLLGLPVPAHVRAATEVFRYHRTVFVAPPWPAIYVHDAERTQDFAESVRTHAAMVQANRECGYELVELPMVSLVERVDFVRQRLGSPRP
jgi:predicted ATPase